MPRFFTPPRLLIVLTAFLAFSSPASAWWDGGHKVIAQIAFEELTATERDWVMQLLESNPTHVELFAEKIAAELGDSIDSETRQRWYFSQAAVWADLVRSREGYSRAAEISSLYNRGSRHYTDIPVFATPQDRSALRHHDVEPDITWKPGMIEPEVSLNSLQTLAKAFAEIPDPAIPIQDRAVDLLWLFHLVGDMHQPCHCAQLFIAATLPEGDRGANQIMVFGIQSQTSGMETDVLHAFWDSLFNGETNTHADMLERAASLRTEPAFWQGAKRHGTVIDPEIWWRQGHAVAKTHVYGPILTPLIRAKAQPHPFGGSRPDIVTVRLSSFEMERYVENAREVSRRQVAIAGLRLAATLQHLHRRALVR